MTTFKIALISGFQYSAYYSIHITALLIFYSLLSLAQENKSSTLKNYLKIKLFSQGYAD